MMKENKNRLNLKLSPKQIQDVRATINYETFQTNKTNEILANLKSQNQIKADKDVARISREERQIELLEDIKNNTGSLVNMLDLIHSNTDQQTELLIILNDIMILATFKDEEKANSKLREIMDKINATIADHETAVKLMTWATTALDYLNKS